MPNVLCLFPHSHTIMGAATCLTYCTFILLINYMFGIIVCVHMNALQFNHHSSTSVPIV
jgi:hypothetical protein